MAVKFANSRTSTREASNAPGVRPGTPRGRRAHTTQAAAANHRALAMHEQAHRQAVSGETEIDKDKDRMAEARSAETGTAVSAPLHSSAHLLRGSDAFPPHRGGVRTVIRGDSQPRTLRNQTSPAGEYEKPAHATVAPGGTPATGNASNDCLPSTASAVLAWSVVSADADNWRPDVTSLTLAGQVNVKPWTNNPNSMTVPNTPNPRDGGNINNTAGSDNHWQAAIDDMADYNTAGGGAGPNWHSTAASSAHEWTHWNTDYVTDSVMSAAGGNWPQTNTDIDALREPKTSSATAADARTALQPRVDARLGTWRAATITRWNAIPDSPGVAGSRGYEAGALILAVHIAAIQLYRLLKGW